ncbi:MAG: hypothetical protein QXH96_00225 [Candidatus Geothermarchaeota archaeon]
MSKKIVEKEPLSLPEMKVICDELKKLPDSELNILQKRMIEYVDKFSKISPEKAVELKKALIEKLNIEAERAVQIINILPRTPDEVREIFYDRAILGDLPQKILKLIEEYTSK